MFDLKKKEKIFALCLCLLGYVCVYRIRAFRGQNSWLTRADDEPQHEFWIRIPQNQSETLTLCQVDTYCTPTVGIHSFFLVCFSLFLFFSKLSKWSKLHIFLPILVFSFFKAKKKKCMLKTIRLKKYYNYFKILSLKTSLVLHHLSSQDSLSCCLHIFTGKNKMRNRSRKCFLVVNDCFCHYRWDTDIPTALWSCKSGINCLTMALLLCWTDVGLMWTWEWSLWAMKHVSSLKQDVC